MRTRFISGIAVGVAGAVLVIASSSFLLLVIATLGLGVGIGTLVVLAATAHRARQTGATLITATVIAAIGGWTIVAGQIFSQPAVENLMLAGALAIGGLGLVGLTFHELSSERIASDEVVQRPSHRSVDLRRGGLGARELARACAGQPASPSGIMRGSCSDDARSRSA